MAVSCSGEQAIELHITNNQFYAAYEILQAAGKVYDLIHFGMRAIDSMRLEKGYGHWKTDYTTVFNLLESGLDRFVYMNKTFVGKSGLAVRQARGYGRQRIMLRINNTKAPALTGEGVFYDNEAVGSITSAG